MIVVFDAAAASSPSASCVFMASQLNADRFGPATPIQQSPAFQRLVRAQTKKPDRDWSAPPAAGSREFSRQKGLCQEV
jgi:hypothetical protein